MDPEERRRRIADALLHVAADQGVQGVSLRQVATAAGVTTGMVQHYFSSKEEMLDFAWDVVSARVASRMSAVDPAAGPTALVRALLVELWPLDERRRVEGRVSVSFYAHATTYPAIADKLRTASAQLRSAVTDGIHTAQTAGELPASLDPSATATGLLALVEGLGIQVHTEHYSSQQALDAFDAHVTALHHGPDR